MKYLDMAGIDACSHEFIFRQLPIRRTLSSLETRLHLCHIQESEKWFYDLRWRALVWIKNVNSLHRLRSGGATAAAAAGVNERVFKMHGRWKSDKAKDGYVKAKNCDTLSVLKNLGIWYVYFLSRTHLIFRNLSAILYCKWFMFVRVKRIRA